MYRRSGWEDPTVREPAAGRVPRTEDSGQLGGVGPAAGGPDVEFSVQFKSRRAEGLLSWGTSAR